MVEQVETRTYIVLAGSIDILKTHVFIFTTIATTFINKLRYKVMNTQHVLTFSGRP